MDEIVLYYITFLIFSLPMQRSSTYVAAGRPLRRPLAQNSPNVLQSATLKQTGLSQQIMDDITLLRRPSTQSLSSRANELYEKRKVYSQKGCVPASDAVSKTDTGIFVIAR